MTSITAVLDPVPVSILVTVRGISYISLQLGTAPLFIADAVILLQCASPPDAGTYRQINEDTTETATRR